MNRRRFQAAVASNFGPLVAAGEITGTQARAAALRAYLTHENKLPASLRAPLRAVEDGTEEPGTAEGVLETAEALLFDEEPKPDPSGHYCDRCGVLYALHENGCPIEPGELRE